MSQTDNTLDKSCVFCDVRKIKSKVYDLGDCVYFEPLNPVVKGHFLVISKTHTTDFSDNPKITARVVEVASELAKNGEYNLITSKGKNATQSINHLHVHLVPRKPNDNLLLPWSNIADEQKKMLEFVIPRQIDQYTEVGGVSGDWIMHGYNQAIDDMSQRAKEWSKKNG